MPKSLKVRVAQVPTPAPPRPPRIKPQVSVADFRRFTPKIVTVPRTPPVQPKPMPKKPKNVVYKAAPAVRVVKPAKKISSPPQKVAAIPKIVQIKPARPARGPAGPAIPGNQPAAINRPVNCPRKQPIVMKANYPTKATPNSTLALKGMGVGKILIMIAAGPSVNEVDFTRLKDHPLIEFMCINQPYQKLWPTKYWAFCDHSQYKRNTPIWDEFKGIIINSTNVRARKGGQYILNSRPGKGFALDVTHGYHIGRSSTYANMQVAYFMGFNKIYIFGVDMCEVGGIMHYYGQNPDVPNERRKERFSAEAENYLWAGKNLSEDVRQRFIFCSSYNPWEFLDHFQRLDQKTAVDNILEFIETLNQ